MPVRVGHSISHLRRMFGKAPLNTARYWQELRTERTVSFMANFKVLDGFVDTKSSEFLSGRSKGDEVTKQFSELLNSSMKGGGEKAIERHTKRNKKLLVRGRVHRLLDEGTDFLELSPFAGLDLEYGDVPCGGVVTGVGQVEGQLCVVIANDATVKGGTIYPITVKKQLRAQEIAEVNELPCIYLVDSGGAFLPLQAEIFPETGGRVFFNEAIMSMKKIPTICVVCGSCTAGAAYVPTMADEAVILDKIGTIFLGGPPLVKAATGEVVTAEELGGALMHCSVSGCTDHYETSEEGMLETTRNIVATLNRKQHETPTGFHAPQFDPEDLLTLAFYDSLQFPVYQVIARLVDGSRFQEFKTKYGSTLITGFAHICGYLVGVVANNGAMTSEAALKGAHFVELCCQRDIPLIFLQNTQPASLAGLSAGQQAYLLKDQAKMMAAVACAQVPKMTVIMKGSLGPNNHSMVPDFHSLRGESCAGRKVVRKWKCGRSFDPRFLFTWPTAQIAMDTAERLADNCCAKNGEGDEDNLKTLKDKLLKKFQKESTAFYGTTRLWDDGLILPQDTRKVLGLSLRAALSSFPRGREHTFGVLRM